MFLNMIIRGVLIMRKIKSNIESLSYPKDFKNWHLYNLSTTREVMQESKAIFIEFVNKYKLDKLDIKSWVSFFGKLEKVPTLENGSMFDHARLFVTKDNKRLYISHPYKNSSLDNDMITIKTWCKERGFKATIHCDSWYYPNKCYCIVFEKEV